MGCFVYAILGSCKDVNIGPTAIMAAMIQPHVEILGAPGAILMTFLTGCIVFLLGLLNLGFLVRFFSYPVIAGFTSAASVQIGSTQIPSLLGIKRKANDFIDAWKIIFESIGDTLLWDAVLGVVCLVILLLMKELKRFGGLKYNPIWSRSRNFFGRISWVLSIARNALVVVVTTLLAYVLMLNDKQPFTLTGTLAEGLPNFKFPEFTIEHNGTTSSFGDIVSIYGSSLAFIPLVCILESVAISKAFSKGKTVDATQEMIAVGISNILGSFFGSIPVTGSFTRTAVNNSSGVRTTCGGIITGIIVLLALQFLTSSFYYIPKATLAAVIISAMINLFEYEAIFLLWKTKRLDLIPFTVTLVASLIIGLEYGILIGIATNLLFLLHSSMKPKLNIEKEKMPEGDVFIVTPTAARIHFPAAEYIRETIMKRCNPENDDKITENERVTVVIDGKYVTNLDATVAKNIKTLADDLKSRNQSIVFWNFKESVKKICTGVDNSMYQYFRDGNLKDIIENPALNRIHPESIVYITA
nr:sodium-independent sulfate anion transporter isoform X2 [Onthophagus taurus]